MPQIPELGVVIVAYNSAPVLRDCLESLLAQEGVRLRIVVVDNASPDATLAYLSAWAEGTAPYTAPEDCPFPLAVSAKPLRFAAELPCGHRIDIIETGVNGGFAFGVNAGVNLLPDLARIWILNPDCMVPAGTARALADLPEGFGLAGGRVCYLDHPERIQIDGGVIDPRTGQTRNLGRGALASQTPPPARMEFITGASMLVSRAFLTAAGPMPEDYFLYYEEVDWALRRGALPLTYCADALVYHRAGTAIGSPALARRASTFSLYFIHRARMRFVRRHLPRAVLGAWAFSLAKALQAALNGDLRAAWTILYASAGRPPAKQIRARLGAAALKQMGQ